jgi:hypothetical protein
MFGFCVLSYISPCDLRLCVFLLRLWLFLEVFWGFSLFLLEGTSFEGCRASADRSGWPMIITVFATLDGARFWHQLIRHNTTKIDEALQCWSSFGFCVDLPLLVVPQKLGYWIAAYEEKNRIDVCASSPVGLWRKNWSSLWGVAILVSCSSLACPLGFVLLWVPWLEN